MRTSSRLVFIGFLLFLPMAALSQATRARLILSAETAKPGETITAGIMLQMDEPWHTYWRNPGEAGIATTIEWKLPPGIQAGEIQWPVPKKDTVADLTTYHYEREVVLLVPVKISSDTPEGEAELAGLVKWLECETGGKCIPGKQDVAARLRVGAESKTSADAALIEQWEKRFPEAGTNLTVTATWEGARGGENRSFVIEADVPAKDFFPYESGDHDISPATEIVTSAAGKTKLRKTVSKTGETWPRTIKGLLVTDEKSYEVEFPVSGDGLVRVSGKAASPQSLLKMLLFACIGGLILNIMPCVFPVIALKIFGFVQQSHDEPRRVLGLGLVYALGVIVSFLVMAGLVIAAQKAGGAASWGMQLQSPQFSVVLLLLVTLVAMNLFGVFEVNLGGGAMSAAGQLASKHGAAGAFFNGVLATLLATPCTAPFLAPALGFAFLQPPPIIVLFFITIALGLASPYVVLSAKPDWLKFLPRPGPWMERFKVAMGFPMLATAVWIFWFTAPRFGDAGELWLGLFLVVLAFVGWIWGQFVQRGGKRRGLAILICIVLLAGFYALALERKLHWRSPMVDVETAWRPWSAEAVSEARAEGRPVIVDFTAKWCLTCNIYVKPALDDPDIRERIRKLNAVTLLADFTARTPAIAAELEKFGSAGVPLVLVYPGDASKPPIVLQEFPTMGAAKKRIADALAESTR